MNLSVHFLQRLRRALLAGLVSVAHCFVKADLILPGADGRDQAFNPVTNVVIDLNAAQIGSWTNSISSPGNGVFDQEKWAVVFRYTSVNIPAGVTVRFINRPDGNPPVVWLVSGDALIDGVVDLSGEIGQDSNRQSKPGPGGFRGGAASRAPGGAFGSSGFGIGGGDRNSTHGGSSGYATGGSFATRPDARSGQTYGGAALIPIIGGSGGGGAAGNNSRSGGGAGGGAMLLAASKKIVLNGSLISRGGDNLGDNDDRDVGAAGAGGGWRLVADQISGRGSIDVRGGDAYGADRNGPYLSQIVQAYGGAGRIRLEALQIGGELAAIPFASFAKPVSPVQLWPSDTAPRVRIASVGTATAPQYPNGGVPGELVVGSDAGTTTVTVEGFNLADTAKVRLRVIPFADAASEFICKWKSADTEGRSVWEAQVPLLPGNASLQVRATTP